MVDVGVTVVVVLGLVVVVVDDGADVVDGTDLGVARTQETPEQVYPAP